MKYRAIIFVSALCALTSSANISDSGHLAPYVNKLSAAEGLDVTYSVNVVGGSKSEYHVKFAKPNKALVTTPSTIYYADGTNITLFNRSKNSYFVQEQTDTRLKSILAEEQYSLFEPFFDPTVFDGAVSTKDEGTRKRRGEDLKIISAQFDSKGEKVYRLYISQQDGLVRQAQFLGNKGGNKTTSILTVDSISTSRLEDSVFDFTPPTGATQLTKTDLRAEFVAGLVSFATTENVETHYNYKPVQPENQEIADRYYKAFIEEFSKYPIEFIKASNLKRIILVEQLTRATGASAAYPDVRAETLIYDVTFMKNEIYARNVMHHEYYHMLEEEWNGDAYYKDPKWAALNDKSFSYGNGGSSANLQSQDVYTLVHPMRGFASWYATYGLEEDKAVVWATLFVPERWKKMKVIASGDSIVNAKIKFLKEFAKTKCAEMDDEYWKEVVGESS